MSGESYRIFGLDPNLPAPAGEAAAACRLHMPRVDLRFCVVQPGGAVRWVHHESELVLDQHSLAVRWIGHTGTRPRLMRRKKDNPVPM
jgi:hypothetical protein